MWPKTPPDQYADTVDAAARASHERDGSMPEPDMISRDCLRLGSREGGMEPDLAGNGSILKGKVDLLWTY